MLVLRTSRVPRHLLALATLVALAACSSPGALEFPERTPTAIDPATTGSVTGVVRFAGTAPAREEVAMGTVAGCTASHATLPLSEGLIVSDGKVANVVVHVKSGLEGKVFPVRREPLTVDQKGCVFVPHVIAVEAFEPVRFTNSDALLHNVRAAGEKNPAFNVALSASGTERVTQFKAPEMIPIKCDVHGWMSAWVAVVESPFHAVTGPDGAFTLTGLPAGTYVLEAWHETLGSATREVTVTEGGKAEAVFSFAAK